MKKQWIDSIERHYKKAVKKHPKFCNEIVHKTHQGSGAKLGRFRDLCEIHGTAEYILMEECYEAIHAYNMGEKQHAIDECFDAIAVMLRMVEQISGELK